MGLTLNELYEIDNEILHSMTLPFLSSSSLLEGREWHDSVVRPNIMLQCGHFETLHISPAKFREELSMWSKMRLSVWTDTLKTTLQKYNLTHNYDRTEEWSETRVGSASDESSHERTLQVDTTGSETGNATLSRNASVEETVAAYNDSDYSPKNKTISTDGGESFNGSDYTKQDINCDTGSSETSRKTDETITHKARISGNIGVTTTQQMLQEERNLVLFNIVQFIVDDFKQYFCIMVY